MTSTRTADKVNLKVIENPDGSLLLETSEGNRIITMGDLLQAGKVDMARYRVSRAKLNSWETTAKVGDTLSCPKCKHSPAGKSLKLEQETNYQVTVQLEPNIERLTLEEIRKQLTADMKAHRPDYKRVKRGRKKKGEQMLLCADFFDLHIGMLAHGAETGEDDWDTKTAVPVVMDTVERLIERVEGFPVTEVLVPMGNDVLHADNQYGTTAKGTRVDIDSRHLKTFRAARRLMVAIIDRLRQIAPVTVKVVPGNHDRERSQYLGEAIYSWYHADPEVTVDNAATLRKYHQFGQTLLGFTHGSDEKPDQLALIMASEASELWAATEFREYHTGHLHRRRKSVTPTSPDLRQLDTVSTHNGVTVRTIPSLVPADAWHASKGYVGGGRAAEVYLYSGDHGFVGHFAHHLPRQTS